MVRKVLPVLSIVGLGIALALALPGKQAYGYGECDAPVPTSASLDEDYGKHGKMQLAWHAYDFSLCDGELVTKSYKIQVYTADGELVREKTRTRNDQFSLPNSATRVKLHHVLDYFTDYKFRVRAIADDGSKSNWSDYYTFTTPLPRIDVTAAVVNYDAETGESEVRFAWEKSTPSENFKRYRFTFKEYTYTPVNSNDYTEELTESDVSKTKKIGKTSYINILSLHDYQDITEESPYTEYYYEATIQAVYKRDGETVKSDVDTLYFRLDGGAIKEGRQFDRDDIVEE